MLSKKDHFVVVRDIHTLMPKIYELSGAPGIYPNDFFVFVGRFGIAIYLVPQTLLEDRELDQSLSVALTATTCALGLPYDRRYLRPYSPPNCEVILLGNTQLYQHINYLSKLDNDTLRSITQFSSLGR